MKLNNLIIITKSFIFLNKILKSMETKVELLLYKSAIEKLLSNIGLIGVGMPFSGLCPLGGYCLLSVEYSIFKQKLNEYAEAIGRDKCMYIWKIRDRAPREEWLKQELKEVKQKLENYGY